MRREIGEIGRRDAGWRGEFIVRRTGERSWTMAARDVLDKTQWLSQLSSEFKDESECAAATPHSNPSATWRGGARLGTGMTLWNLRGSLCRDAISSCFVYHSRQDHVTFGYS